jgi:hypothetical protein
LKILRQEDTVPYPDDCSPLTIQSYVYPGIHFAAFGHIVGWVKRDVGIIYVGFAYLDAPQKSEIATKLANPTILVAIRRLNPTYDLAFKPTKWIAPFAFLSSYEVLWWNSNVIPINYRNWEASIVGIA